MTPAGGPVRRVLRTRFRALGTYGELVLLGGARDLAAAVAILRAELAAIDLACSRFRADSELSRLSLEAARPAGAATGGSGGRAGPAAVAVSAVLAEAVAVAVRAAEQTDGDVDPTLGAALAAAGYDVDFASVPPDGPAVTGRPPRRAAWREIQVDLDGGTVRLPSGVRLDLGATAKAFAADRAAARIAAAVDAGVLVNLGGDLAVAGPPPAAGWPVRITDGDPALVGGLAVAGAGGAARAGAGDETAGGPAAVGLAPVGAGHGDQVVHMAAGGLATSSTAVRRWRRGGRVYHHILDPRTGEPAAPCWRTVTVAAATCADANTASTAAVVRGRAATGWLAGLGLPARLVDAGGRVCRVGGWPEEAPTAGTPAVVPARAAAAAAGAGARR